MVTEFDGNPNPVVPCGLVLDTSGSMLGPPIEAQNAGIRALFETLRGDSLAKKRVELAVVTFGGEVTTGEFRTVDKYETVPQFAASGQTPLAEALDRMMDLLQVRRRELNDQGKGMYRPWVVLITDGFPTDPEPVVSRVAARAVAEQTAEPPKFSLYAVAVAGADLQLLSRFCVPERMPQALEGFRYEQLFKWVSKSVQSVSRSRLGDEVELPPISGWART